MTNRTCLPAAKIHRIVSGAQTGVDRAALDFAMSRGIDHGGWVPKGRKAEDGPLPTLYKMVETKTTGYAERTRRNVLDSDGTLIIYEGRLSGRHGLDRRHRPPGQKASACNRPGDNHHRRGRTTDMRMDCAKSHRSAQHSRAAGIAESEDIRTQPRAAGKGMGGVGGQSGGKHPSLTLFPELASTPPEADDARNERQQGRE